ncbi:MAG TPA: YHS domain-containing (seleno)protein [Ferruginibacter sp.]|nr:YHS domain-containing (seleno)protein [Ferruginibacter sp.]HMP20520.1 YHS domain-containing (seleno)protein [Ferruginibacter sp.]
MKKSIQLLLVILITGFMQVQAQSVLYNTNKGLALAGYDAVEYHISNKAVKGKKEFAVMVENVTYYFVNAANKDRFKADYKKYLPEYGGWCAYAMGASGEKVAVDPETFKVLNGKLYLFYHSWVNNTLTKWNKDEASLKAKADANWKKIVQAP